MCKWTMVLRARGSGNDSCRGIADSGIESDSGFAIAIAVVLQDDGDPRSCCCPAFVGSWRSIHE